MIYEYCSSESVIADVLDRTRMTDDTFADSMLEWLRSGLNLMRLKVMYTRHNQVIEVNDNVAKWPCGITSVDGIFYNGSRLRLGTGAVDTRCAPFSTLKQNFDSYFVSDTTSDGYTDNEQSYLLVRGDDLKLQTIGECTNDYYIPLPNHFQTSFKTGCVQLFFRRMPVDDRGYPLIPEEENTKYALFWWIMGQLALTGYKHNDPKMDYDYCENKFDIYRDESRKKLKHPSTDKKEAVLRLTCNLIPPYGYYDQFFINGEQPRFVNK